MESNTQKLKKQFTADLRPAYYDSFQCIGGACKLNCCQDPWNITFDRKDYLKVRQQKGSDALNSAIKEALTRTKSSNSMMYAAFRQNENGCPLLTEEGLCRLQAECGYDTLPDVCKTFPRRKVYSPSGYYEYSLSPACEAVLELLWNLPEGIDFVSDPMPQTEYTTRIFSPEDVNLASHFQEIRSLCIGLLQDRRFSVQERILLMGIFLQKLTAADVDIPAWLEQTEAMLQHPQLAAIVSPLFTAVTEEQQKLVLMQHAQAIFKIHVTKNHKALHEFMQTIINQLSITLHLNIETPADAETIQLDDFVAQGNVTLDMQKFLETRSRFSQTFAEREYFFENLAVSVFFYKTFPECPNGKALWKSYVDFCNLYSLFRFVAIASYLEPHETEEAAKNALFHGIIYISRSMLHNAERAEYAAQKFFDNENHSLPYMAMLLSI